MGGLRNLPFQIDLLSPRENVNERFSTKRASKPNEPRCHRDLVGFDLEFANSFAWSVLGLPGLRTDSRDRTRLEPLLAQSMSML